MIRFSLMLLAAAFGFTATSGVAQEVKTEAKTQTVENANQKTKKPQGFETKGLF